MSASTDILLDDSCKPDINFLDKNFQCLDMPYLMSTEIQNFLDNSLDPFSVLHLNIITIIKKL